MINSINHVGISVASLDRSIHFYRDLLGMEVVVPETTFSGPHYEAILNLKGATGKVALVKAANLQLELFEFMTPAPKPSDPDRPVCDHGITHFCIEVADAQSVYDRLSAAGVTFHCPPLNFFGEAIATYARDPDGNVFEVLQMTGVPNT